MIKLMIVEDEQLEREALRVIVSKHYANRILIVEDAADGKEAVCIARRRRPDIILMDIGLPEENGLDSQEKIVQFLPDVQTIMVTAFSDFCYIQKALQNKTVDYLLKPVRPKELIKAIDKVLEKIEKKESEKPLEIAEPINSIQQAVQYIDQNFTEKLSLEMIAAIVHLNSQYLSRKFKQEMKVGIMEYINQKRVHSAKNYLMNTNLPIYRIAQETGFSDSSHFCKVFSKMEKQKPSDYRKSQIRNAHIWTQPCEDKVNRKEAFVGFINQKKACLKK